MERPSALNQRLDTHLGILDHCWGDLLRGSSVPHAIVGLALVVVNKENLLNERPIRDDVGAPVLGPEPSRQDVICRGIVPAKLELGRHELHVEGVLYCLNDGGLGLLGYGVLGIVKHAVDLV